MLDDLHWLPLQQRIQFRLSCIAWRCVQALAPSYLCELFAVPATLGHRSLRSNILAEIFGSLLPVLQLHRKDPSWLLVQPSGMTSQLPSTPFLAIPQIPFLDILRPFFLIRPGSGAPLSRDLEGALYKFD